MSMHMPLMLALTAQVCMHAQCPPAPCFHLPRAPVGRTGLPHRQTRVDLQGKAQTALLQAFSSGSQLIILVRLNAHAGSDTSQLGLSWVPVAVCTCENMSHARQAPPVSTHHGTVQCSAQVPQQTLWRQTGCSYTCDTA